MPGLNRSDELEKHGVPVSRARSKMAMASASEPATGLSMNTGLRARKTGRACSRCGRPSTLSSRTTSTFDSSSSIESDDRDAVLLLSSRVKPATRSRLEGMIRAPAGIGRDDADAGQLGLGGGRVQELGERDHVRGIQADDAGSQRLRRSGILGLAGHRNRPSASQPATGRHSS